MTGEVKSFQSGMVHDWYKPRLAHGTDQGADYFGPSMTRQEFAEDADINTIMARYERTGELPVNRGEPLYLDLTTMPSDLQTAMAALQHAEDVFMQLPAVVRKEFDNSPEAFVDYASNPDNLGQMREWGLAPPAPVVDAPAAPGATPMPPPPELVPLPSPGPAKAK